MCLFHWAHSGEGAQRWVKKIVGSAPCRPPARTPTIRRPCSKFYQRVTFAGYRVGVVQEDVVLVCMVPFIKLL